MRPLPFLVWSGFVVAALTGVGGCSCNEKPVNPCPASFTVGELCSTEGLVCTWPESKCQTTVCTCENQPGGFYWKCPATWCVCTCPCGYTGRVSCESLECENKPEDSCPASVAEVCALVCAEPPDGGPRDGRSDRRGDGPLLDRPPPADIAPDRTGDRPADRPVDQAADRPADRSAGDAP